MDRRESFVTLDVAAQSRNLIAKANPQRVFLAFAPASANNPFTTSRQWVSGQGFFVDGTQRLARLPFHEWGPIIQMDWFCINLGGGLSNFVTVWEVIADNAVEAKAWTFRGYDDMATPSGLENRRNHSPLDGVLLNGNLPRSFDEELRAVKGAIWNRIRAKTSGGETIQSPWTDRVWA